MGEDGEESSLQGIRTDSVLMSTLLAMHTMEKCRAVSKRCNDIRQQRTLQHVPTQHNKNFRMNETCESESCGGGACTHRHSALLQQNQSC